MSEHDVSEQLARFSILCEYFAINIIDHLRSFPTCEGDASEVHREISVGRFPLHHLVCCGDSFCEGVVFICF